MENQGRRPEPGGQRHRNGLPKVVAPEADQDELLPRHREAREQDGAPEEPLLELPGEEEDGEDRAEGELEPGAGECAWSAPEHRQEGEGQQVEGAHRPAQDDPDGRQEGHHGGAENGRPRSGQRGVGKHQDRHRRSGDATGERQGGEQDPQGARHETDVQSRDREKVGGAGLDEAVREVRIEAVPATEQERRDQAPCPMVANPAQRPLRPMPQAVNRRAGVPPGRWSEDLDREGRGRAEHVGDAPAPKDRPDVPLSRVHGLPRARQAADGGDPAAGGRQRGARGEGDHDGAVKGRLTDGLDLEGQTGAPAERQIRAVRHGAHQTDQ